MQLLNRQFPSPPTFHSPAHTQTHSYLILSNLKTNCRIHGNVQHTMPHPVRPHSRQRAPSMQPCMPRAHGTQHPKHQLKMHAQTGWTQRPWPFHRQQTTCAQRLAARQSPVEGGMNSQLVVVGGCAIEQTVQARTSHTQTCVAAAQGPKQYQEDHHQSARCVDKRQGEAHSVSESG